MFFTVRKIFRNRKSTIREDVRKQQQTVIKALKKSDRWIEVQTNILDKTPNNSY